MSDAHAGNAHREELGVAVDAGQALPHHPRLPQVPLVRDQQVQRPVLVLRQRACGLMTWSLMSVGLGHSAAVRSGYRRQSCCHVLLLLLPKLDVR